MKKSFYHFLLAGLALIVLAACGNKPKEAAANEAPAETPAASPSDPRFDLPVVAELPEGTGATAPPTTPEQASFEEYAAFYEGVLPCKDCDGIKVTLLLNADKYRSYNLKEEHLGKSNAPIMEKTGTWSVKDGIIGLAYGADIVKYQSSAKGLLQLDKNGKPMDDKKHFLKKL
ncbi:MAG: copper resistance protein NlpE N-terminal domain-containing protein [Saprospiraceae bacterium]|nr:copper resistance protein NlpE N-terminal domain-containing protein [Saprospiraceae bacterium]